MLEFNNVVYTGNLLMFSVNDIPFRCEIGTVEYGSGGELSDDINLKLSLDDYTKWYKEFHDENVIGDSLEPVIDGDDVIVTNADTIIVYLYDVLESRIDLHTDFVNISISHPFWIFHDILHALNDTCGNSVEVNSSVEYVRLVDAYNICVRYGINIDVWFLEKVDNAYNDRFTNGSRMDLSIQHLEYLIEEEE